MSLSSKKKCWILLDELAQLRNDDSYQNIQQIGAPNYSSLEVNSISYNCSYQKINPKILNLLIGLAKESDLQLKINNLFSGAKVNSDEGRAALHTALRLPKENSSIISEKSIIENIFNSRNLIQSISDSIRAKKWLGYTGEPIRNIVNIGIGGSDLGPKFCIKALANYVSKDLNYYFISDRDYHSLRETLAQLIPETTLFIISSKSFETQETLINAQIAMQWMDTPAISQHFIAVTAHPQKALDLGIKNVLPIWDWVGGRYSLCSAINLITAIGIGYTRFEEMLWGAHQMDEHFRTTEFAFNMPVLLALIGIWNINFKKINTLLILAYSGLFEFFVPYIQQLEMESNGKSIDNNGNRVNYSTSPIVWGGLGNQAQHSYYQLLCQGTHKITTDLITIEEKHTEFATNLCKAKMKVLNEGVKDLNNPKKIIEGNTPFNHLAIKSWSPSVLGTLIALYEHKVYVQSVIWNINPFNQPGVDSTKALQRIYSKNTFGQSSYKNERNVIEEFFD